MRGTARSTPGSRPAPAGPVAIAWVLLATVFTGCFGVADDAPIGGAVATASVLDALGMEGANVVARTDTSVTFLWADTIGPGVYDPRDGSGGSTLSRTTAFDIPAARVIIAATLNWTTPDVDLTLAVRDGIGTETCADLGSGMADTPLSAPVVAPDTNARACSGPLTIPGSGSARGAVRIGTALNPEVDVPFLVTLTFSLPALPAGVSDGVPCVHPWPCADGSEWPLGLTGPFDLLEDVRVEIPSHDGVLLSARLWRPDLPDGVGAPTILVSDPYLGNPTTTSNVIYARMALRDFVPNGYALLVASLRGTASSGGCFDHNALPSQLDPAALADWVAVQPWSNGRVGMHGLSYMGVAGVHGVVHGSEVMKTAIVVGVPQAYLYHHTPQGAYSTSATLYELDQHNVLTPPVHGDPDLLVPSITRLPERSCDEYRRNLVVEGKGEFTDDRDPAFWQERDMYRQYPNVTAALFMVEGFHDAFVPWGNEVAWDLLPGPKRMMYGQWGHRMPPLDSWRIDQLAWFDYWLKGVGEPPGLGTVAFQDDAHAWHASAGWPPREVREEVLYLRSGTIDPVPAPGDAAYRSSPQRGEGFPTHFLCDGLDAGTALVFEGPDVDEEIVVAGNPFAFLTVTSDQRGGLFGVYLLSIPEGGGCDDAKWLTWGAADLRFHEGNLIGTDFPVGTPTPIRIDFEPIAAKLAKGDRLAVVVTHPGPYDDRDVDDVTRILPHGPGSNGRSGQPFLPVITIHGGADAAASHLVLPMIDGTLGGSAPTSTYPPRPFMPLATAAP